MFFWKKIVKPLIQVGCFLALYYFVGEQVLEKLISPALDKLPSKLPLGLHLFLNLDSGRILSRIFSFVWTLFLFFLFQKFVHKRPWRENILFHSPNKLKTLFWGSLFGGFLVCSLIYLAIATETITIKAVHLFPSDILSTFSLYIFAMILTAVSEEIAMRGYILQTLKENWGTHWAVWLSAFVFGMIHLPISFYYAYAAFVAGLVLGYAYVWYGIYYCIGWHFMWNFIESVFFSGKIILFRVNDPFLIGAKDITPDQEGFLVLPVILIGFAILLAVNKTEWRLKS